MKRVLIILLLIAFSQATHARPRNDEWIILVGGPSLYEWEKYKAQPHDHWWANFVRAGDLLAIMSAGAYGFTMASNYNSRPLPAEVLIRGDKFALVRKRQTWNDLVRGEIDS